MSEKWSKDHTLAPIRRTQARIHERERRRAERERNERLKWQIPFAVAGLLVVLAIAIFALNTFAKPKPASAGVIGPRLQVNTVKLDLGHQPLGKSVHASFDVKNTGDDALTLNSVQTATVLEGC